MVVIGCLFLGVLEMRKDIEFTASDATPTTLEYIVFYE
jgi:hypothetical protein